MDRTDVAYLVNTTPKYFYMLPLHFLLVRRYSEKLHWPLFLATECPNDPVVNVCRTRYRVNILPLSEADQHFLESRLAATKALPPEIRYVFPIQEDFLLQYRTDDAALERALKIFDDDPSVASIRLMPCPGPSQIALPYNAEYAIAAPNKETMYFTFQATLHRREVYEAYMTRLVAESASAPTVEEKLRLQLKANIAENHQGQEIFRTLRPEQKHLIWRRAHTAPNAVYLSPWPYRPTAVEKGALQTWAKDFADREGLPLLIHNR